MLKIFNYEEYKKESIEFDMYIPINIEFGVWDISKEPTIYWRTGDFKESLIEIGIGKYKKDIRSVTLTICKNVYEVENYYQNNSKIVKGSPILELENINEEIYIDEESKINLYIENKCINIMFSEKKISNCLQNENVYFYLDDDKSFIGLKIDNIMDENKVILKEALGFL